MRIARCRVGETFGDVTDILLGPHTITFKAIFVGPHCGDCGPIVIYNEDGDEVVSGVSTELPEASFGVTHEVTYNLHLTTISGRPVTLKAAEYS